MTALWSYTHPHVPLLTDLPLIAQDVVSVPAIKDVKCFLQELSARCATVELEHGQFFLTGEEALRLATVLPSWAGLPLMAVEHEHALPLVYRLRCLLLVLGLVRIYQGKLRVNQRRYQSFLLLPPVQQFYVLWHTEAYHVGWGKFAGMWHTYLEMVQGYLPLLWDVYSDVEAGEVEEAQLWSQTAIELFNPIWEEEHSRPLSRGILTMYQQAALPAILEKLVLQDILVRYGLLVPVPSPVALLGGRSAGCAAGLYEWTHMGQTLLHAEHHHDLPCGVDLLKDMAH